MSKSPKDSLWLIEPIESLIISNLLRNPKKTFNENELYEKIKQEYDKVSYNLFIKALIKLEIWGKLNVTSGRKGQKMISLNAGN
ncbi:MAG: hypothetical protein NDF57_00865 [archaeon GBS-70-058]|nr:hypothetical protein [Candidatus Culexarchaeum nevadense]